LGLRKLRKVSKSKSRKAQEENASSSVGLWLRFLQAIRSEGRSANFNPADIQEENPEIRTDGGESSRRNNETPQTVGSGGVARRLTTRVR
jgi:hypothetical protein